MTLEDMDDIPWEPRFLTTAQGADLHEADLTSVDSWNSNLKLRISFRLDRYGIPTSDFFHGGGNVQAKTVIS